MLSSLRRCIAGLKKPGPDLAWGLEARSWVAQRPKRRCPLRRYSAIVDGRAAAGARTEVTRGVIAAKPALERLAAVLGMGSDNRARWCSGRLLARLKGHAGAV